MPITTQDIKLFKSERIADTPDGGGRQTGVEVIDGELNNVFDDTSRDDRVNGRVSLRKVFGSVRTADTQKFLGVHAILSDPPDDGRVFCTLFQVPLMPHSAERDDAKSLIEQYVVAAQTTLIILLDTQPAGSRTLVGFQTPIDPIPEANEILCLSVEKAGHINNGYRQFVRITDITSQITVLQPSNTEKRIITMELSDALEIDFPGEQLTATQIFGLNTTKLRKVDLNPLARFYGIVPVASPIAIGATAIKASTILQPLSPTAYAETPFLDRQVGVEGAAVVQASAVNFTEPAVSVTVAAGVLALRAMRAVVRTSLTFTVSSAQFSDNGDGTISRVGGSGFLGASGSVDYPTGDIMLSGFGETGAHTITLTYLPAAAVPDALHTAGTEVTLANRGFNWPKTLIPKPARGSVVATYRALGRWYTLLDNGVGQLTGPVGTGVGTVNYITGTVNLTTGYQPDVGSYVLFGWGTGAHYTMVATDPDIEIGAIRLDTNVAIEPGSLSVTWTIASVSYTVTDDGDGNCIGDCVSGRGFVDYSGRQIQFLPTVYPAKLSTITVAYNGQAETGYVPTPQPTPSGGNVSFTVPGAPFEPGSVIVSANFARNSNGNVTTVVFTDAGDGSLAVNIDGNTETRGSVNYTTGVVSIHAAFSI